ncbi:MAG: RecQ family ATP-dependent DNA helicase [Rikenellaceae bacterium]|nr:RecQ family ATP-dependent DNA helicase [Rikenellaceae bacterium]
MSKLFHNILKKYWGYDSFRPPQLETIQTVAGGDDVLVLMPTGGGKSIIYQVPGLALPGICVVVTPLIALMKDQTDRLRRMGIAAVAVHSGMTAREIDIALDNCVYGDVKFLYISPERAGSEMFRLRYGLMQVSLLAVDEAHCISQWGYDFRPAYLRIAELRELHPETPVLALTATATPEVAEDIMHHLRFRKPRIFRVSFARPNLSYAVRRTEDKEGHLLRILHNVPGSAIVYVRTRDRTEAVARLLCENGIAADFYHGGLGYTLRGQRQDNWLAGRTRVMVATNAFGMGIDKADVRVVVHYDICDSLEAYYQEAGRAGRDGQRAYAVLLTGPDDPGKTAKRFALEFPAPETIRNIYDSLFNYLQIAIGEGRFTSRDFNLPEFAARARVFTPTAFNALKILQQNGYLILTDEMDNPTRILFTVRRDDLYKIRIDRAELDHFLRTLLRLYNGLFSELTPVNEQEIVQATGYTLDRVNELFKVLWQLRVIRYVPGSRSPLLILTEERLPTANLRLSPESYAQRKETASARIEAMFRYTEETTCRTLFIQRYFGEQADEPCGICDLCLARRKASRDEAGLRQLILEAIGTGRYDIRSLAARISADIGRIIAAVDQLTAEGLISVDPATGHLAATRR